MSRPAPRRRGLVVALLSASMLAACTGNADDGGSEAPQTPAVAPTAATAAANGVMSAVATALTDATPAGVAARTSVLSGAALESANAWAKTLPGRTAVEKADAELSPSDPKVLGVSRVGESPKQILVQTTLKKSGAAVLALLVADDSNTFKVAALTPMLPAGRLDALDATSTGSAPIGNGAGLAASPDSVAQAFAASVAFPDPTTTSVLAKDPLSDQLRTSAAAQAQAIGAQGAFTQAHVPSGVLGGLRLKDGKGAIVFVHLVRNDAIAMRSAVKLTPAKELTLLTGIKQITTEAKLVSNEIIAIVIPATGPARIIASSDQLVAGSGR